MTLAKKPGQGGRNQAPRIHTQRAVTPAASSNHPEQTHSRVITKLHKLLRLLRELQFKQSLSTHKEFSSQASTDVAILAEKIYKHCSSLKPPCSKEWKAIKCDHLITAVDSLVASQQKAAKISHIRAWKKKIRDSFDLHQHGAKAHEWLNSKAPSNMQALSAPDGSVVTSINGMLNVIADAGQNLFHQKELVNLDFNSCS